jgi:hypothetical protein
MAAIGRFLSKATAIFHELFRLLLAQKQPPNLKN